MVNETTSTFFDGATAGAFTTVWNISEKVLSLAVTECVDNLYLAFVPTANSTTDFHILLNSTGERIIKQNPSESRAVHGQHEPEPYNV